MLVSWALICLICLIFASWLNWPKAFQWVEGGLNFDDDSFSFLLEWLRDTSSKAQGMTVLSWQGLIFEVTSRRRFHEIWSIAILNATWRTRRRGARGYTNRLRLWEANHRCMLHLVPVPSRSVRGGRGQSRPTRCQASIAEISLMRDRNQN